MSQAQQPPGSPPRHGPPLSSHVACPLPPTHTAEKQAPASGDPAGTVNKQPGTPPGQPASTLPLAAPPPPAQPARSTLAAAPRGLSELRQAAGCRAGPPWAGLRAGQLY